MTLRVHDISGFRDPLLKPLLDSYQESFHGSEQMRLSWWLETVAGLEDGAAPHRRLQAFLDGETFAGWALFESEAEKPEYGYLWYLAVPPALRGRGCGSEIYRAICTTLFDSGCRILVFEVDRPEVEAAVSPEAAATAVRRIGWYQRMGARLLTGIDYVQNVGWWPKKSMAVMVHAAGPVPPEAAFEAASYVLGKDLKPAGAPGLVPSGGPLKAA